MIRTGMKVSFLTGRRSPVGTVSIRPRATQRSEVDRREHPGEWSFLHPDFLELGSLWAAPRAGCPRLVTPPDAEQKMFPLGARGTAPPIRGGITVVIWSMQHRSGQGAEIHATLVVSLKVRRSNL